MKRLILTLLVFVVSFAFLTTNSSRVYGANATINNTTYWMDTNGQAVKAQGGNIIKAGGYYYLVGLDFSWTGTVPATTEYGGYNAVKVYRSTDLVTWEFRNNIVYPGITGWPSYLVEASAWVGRPSILYNASTNKYVLIVHMGGSIVSATADTPDGVYTFAKTMTSPNLTTINDISCFQDGADAYLVANMNQTAGAREAGIIKLTSDYLDFQGVIYRDSNGGYEKEAHQLVKMNGLWYWFASGTYYWYSTPTSYRVSSSLTGPWGDYTYFDTNPQRPIAWDKMDSFNTQHDFILPITGTQGTTLVYFGDTYSQFTGIGNRYNAAFPVTYNGTTFVLNGYDQWQLDTVTGTWSVPGGSTPTIVNPGFESGTTGWTLTNGATIINSQQHTGLNSTYVPGYLGDCRQDISVEPNSSYTLSAWAVSSSKGKIGVIVNGTSTELSLPNSTSWVKSSISFTTGASTTSVTIYAKNKQGSQYSYVDDWSIVKN